jgi:hypothetical protein
MTEGMQRGGSLRKNKTKIKVLHWSLALVWSTIFFMKKNLIFKNPKKINFFFAGRGVRPSRFGPSQT